MRNYIFVLFVFISSSAFLFAQTESDTINAEPLYVSPTNSESSARARILARQKLLQTVYEPCIENYRQMIDFISRRAHKKGKKAFNKTSVYQTDSYGGGTITRTSNSRRGTTTRTSNSRGRRESVGGQGSISTWGTVLIITLTNREESDAAYRQAYEDEFKKLCEEYGVETDCYKQHIRNTIEDLDKSMDMLRKRNIDPGHISHFYSNQAMITDEEDIEYLLKNITANNNDSKPLEKYTKNNVARIYLVVYQWDKGCHIKAFLFTPEGVIFERLYFTNARNAVNPRTGTTIYVTEEEALIFTQG